MEADGSVYGLTVSGTGLISYVNPTFRVGVDEVVDIVVEEHSSARMKLAADGVLGDVDGNGQVDVFDVLYVLLYSVDSSIVLPNNGDISRGDVNGDGLVDVADSVGSFSGTSAIHPIPRCRRASAKIPTIPLRGRLRSI